MRKRHWVGSRHARQDYLRHGSGGGHVGFGCCADPRDGSVMHAAIGRPRLMHVLYPWQGKEVLCVGVVMPYHEVKDTKTLTDAEWRERFRVRDGKRPPVPEWLKGFVPLEGVKLTGRDEE